MSEHSAAVARRIFFAAPIVALLFACGGPVSPPTFAMRFEISRGARDAIGPALSDFSARDRFKFTEIDLGIDRSFTLERPDLRILVGPGGWLDPMPTTHEWPYEYQVLFYPAQPDTDVEALAASIGAVLAAIPGVRKSGPNFVPSKTLPDTAT